MARIATFDDWIDLFRKWQKDIGVDRLAEALQSIFQDQD